MLQLSSITWGSYIDTDPLITRGMEQDLMPSRNLAPGSFPVQDYNEYLF